MKNHSDKYFHTTHTAMCYDDIVKDPSLLWLFPKRECTSLWELPVLGPLQFRLISERVFTCVPSSDIWGKTTVEFVTNMGLRIRKEVTPMVITDGIGEENLGMVTIFCHHDQNKMEASNTLAALCQCDSPEPSVVVVKRCTNTPYIPQGTFCLLYLDVSTLSWGASSTQFLLDHLHLWRLLPYSRTEVLLPCEVVLWKSSEGEHCLSGPVSRLIPSSPLFPHLEESTQTEEELGYNPALQWLQDFHQARTQLECELGEEAQELAYKMIIRSNCQETTSWSEQKWPRKEMLPSKRSLWWQAQLSL